MVNPQTRERMIELKIDKRKHYLMVLDTETANSVQNGDKLDMSNVLVYDCGWAIVDTKGNIYETASYVNSDIFYGEKDLMQSAYYSEKIPRYLQDIKQGLRKISSTCGIRKAMLEAIEKWGIKEVAAHNARFDYNALNTTQRYVTASKYRYWFPFDKIEIWDTMKMSQDVICQMPTYKKFCQENNYLTKSGQCRKTAEILYRFISKNNDFVESHTGLEDVLIEAQILAYCYRQHKPMRKTLFENKKEYLPFTEFQRQLSQSIKDKPILRMGV